MRRFMGQLESCKRMFSISLEIDCKRPKLHSHGQHERSGTKTAQSVERTMTKKAGSETHFEAPVTVVRLMLIAAYRKASKLCPY